MTTLPGARCDCQGAAGTLGAVVQFWDTVVLPLLKALEPRVVVEVGMLRGGTSGRLLDFAAAHDAVVHGIDPADPPGFDLEGFVQRHGERFVFHNEPSLDVLPRIRDPDAVLLDGDHNWYTVFNELTTLERVACEEQRPFPLTLMHDVDWPWGRRDMYYAPERIPADQRNGVTTGGMRPGQPELTERGYGWRVLKAPLSDTPRNGVRTAIEDFLAETAVGLEFHSIPGFHGCGILVDTAHLQQPRVKAAMGRLDSPDFWREHCTRVEEARWRAVVNLAETRQQARLPADA